MIWEEKKFSSVLFGAISKSPNLLKNARFAVFSENSSGKLPFKILFLCLFYIRFLFFFSPAVKPDHNEDDGNKGCTGNRVDDNYGIIQYRLGGNRWGRGVNTLEVDCDFGGETSFTIKIFDNDCSITRRNNSFRRCIVPVWESDRAGN